MKKGLTKMILFQYLMSFFFYLFVFSQKAKALDMLKMLATVDPQYCFLVHVTHSSEPRGLTCHISPSEIKSHRILPIWKAIPIKNSNLTEFSEHFTADFIKK